MRTSKLLNLIYKINWCSLHRRKGKKTQSIRAFNG